jgi:hypothetical protein
MNGVGRVPPRPPPIAVATVTSAPATLSHAADPAHPAQASAAPAPGHAHHAHHAADHGGGHGAHHVPHAPKPRRPPKPRKGRRKSANGVVSDEDEADFDAEEAGASATAPVSFDSDKHGGGDDHESGGGDSSREDRIHRARFEADDAAALNASARPAARRSSDTSFAANRYHRGLCDAMVGYQARPDAGARVERLDLQLMEATADVARVDSGGFERALANLLAHAPPARTGADRPTPDSREGRLNCMAFMKELNLQRRRTQQQKQQGIAQLKLRLRARTP